MLTGHPRWIHRAIPPSAGFAHCFIVFFFASIVPASAQNRATLDLLVKRGVISQAEADCVGQTSATPAALINAKNSAVKGLQLEGMIRLQYDFFTTEDKASGAANPPSTNQFEIRHAYLGALADLGNGWGGEIELDFAASQQTQSPTGGAASGNVAVGQNSFEKVVITKKIPDYGTLTAGYRKVNFTQEELTPWSKLKAIERSPATRYFDENFASSTSRRLALANRHTGLYWDGNVTNPDGILAGAYYSLAVTDGYNNQNLQVSNADNLGYNRLAYWAAAGYQGAIADWKYDFGVHTGLSQTQNSNGLAGAASQANAEWGWNPYVTVDRGDFELSVEFLQAWVQRGRASGVSTSEATPYGINLTPSYKINPEWEVSFRYSYLDTNGRGTNISDAIRNANNPTFAGGGTTNLFNTVNSYYLGVNYDIVGPSVKLSLGYEIDDFTNRQIGAAGTGFTGPRAVASGFRTQLQLQF